MTSKTMPTNYRCPLRASNSPHSSDSSLFTATFPIFHPITEGLGIHTIESRSPNANPTVLPDAFLKNMAPICLIQHPAYTFPSSYRAAQLNVRGSEFFINASPRWGKLLVDWYTATTGTKPLVYDEADLIHEPGTIQRLCRALSIDESKLQKSRDTMPQPELGEPDATPAGKARKQDDEIDLDEEARGWAKEFGVDAAETIKGFVLGAMDDYSYLRRFANR